MANAALTPLAAGLTHDGRPMAGWEQALDRAMQAIQESVQLAALAGFITEEAG